MKKPQHRKDRPTGTSETNESPVFERLEPRVLYSADALGISALLLPEDNDTSADEYVSYQSVNDFDSIENAPHNNTVDIATNPIEFVFIDARVEDSNTFVEAWASDGVHFVVINEHDDALGVINRHLNSATTAGDSVSSLRIVSHGGDGFLQLGNAHINEKTLNENDHLLAQWSEVMTSDADILLYGCNVAQSDFGISFVEKLANITGADVAASDDITGNASQGGDWDLEFSYGETLNYSALDTQRMADWTHSLAVLDVFNRTDSNISDGDTLSVSQFNGLTNGTLRQAIQAANNTPGDDVIRLIGNQGDFEISRTLILNSDNDSGNIIIENHTGADVSIRPEIGSIIRLMQVQNNSLTIEGDPNSIGNSLVLENGQNTSGDGGALFASLNTTLTVNNVSFINNEAFKGGAIFSEGNLQINHSVFERNEAIQGGAVHAGGSVNIDDSLFEDNAADFGGAIFVTGSATDFTINNSNFISNKTDVLNNNSSDGGAIFSNAFLVIENSTFTNNIADNRGGAIYTTAGIRVENSVFDGNTTSNAGGGAIYSTGNVISHNSEFKNNSAIDEGGAIVSQSEIQISNSHFQNNHALSDTQAISNKFDTRGGAVYTVQGGSIDNSSFVGNKAISGSAVYISGRDIADDDGNPVDTLSINNTTFTKNETFAVSNYSAIPGGTVYSSSRAGLVVTSSTFADNSSPHQTAGILSSPISGASVSSSVFLNNTVSGEDRGDVPFAVSAGFNVSDEILSQTSLSNPIPTDIVDPNLALGALTTQAGGVVQVRPPLAGSSVINAGSLSSNETDAFNQAADALPDAGAFEFQGPSDTVYWADEDGKIWRSDAELLHPVLIGDTGHNISGLVVDLNGFNNDGAGRILWIDQDTSTIHSAQLDGTAIGAGPNVTILSGPVDALNGEGLPLIVNSLTFDEDRDLLFVTHSATPYHPAAIRVWEIDTFGSTYIREIETPSGNPMDNPRDIHYSTATGRLYWIEGEPGTSDATIHSSNTDGSDYQLLFTGATSDDFGGLVTDDTADFLYFTNQADGTVNRFDLASNSLSNTLPISSNGSISGVQDIAFVSNNSELLVTDSTNNQIYSLTDTLEPSSIPYDHSATPVVLASASTTPANEPSFYIENFDYMEGLGPKIIDANHIIVNNPDNSNLTFALISGPETSGGSLAMNGVLLTPNDQFTLSDVLTYSNDFIANETSDVFQIQLYDDEVAVGPVKAFVVSLTGIDDAATFSIAPITAVENTTNTPLSLADFNLVDEENVIPDAYSVTEDPLTNYGVKPLVNGSPTFYFTHEDLALGNVTISTEDTIILPANATTPVTATLQVIPQVEGSDMSIFNPTGPFNAGVLTVDIIPVDDKAEILSSLSGVQLSENSILPLIGADYQFHDEESVADDVIYRVTDTGDSNLVLLTLNDPTLPNSVTLNVGDTFTQAQFSANYVQIDSTHANLTSDSVSTSISFQAVTDVTDPSFSSASDPFVLNIDILQANDRPTVDIVIPVTGHVVSENAITELNSTLFEYNDEENDTLQHYELTQITKSDGSGPINNINIMNNGQVMMVGDTFTEADLNSGHITIDATDAILLSNDVLHIHLRAVSEENASHESPTTGVPFDHTTYSEEFILVLDVQTNDDSPVLELNQTEINIEEGLQPTVIRDDVFRFTDEEDNALSHYELAPHSLPAGIELLNAGNPINNPGGDQILVSELMNGSITISAENAVIEDDVPRVYTLTFNAVDENGVKSNTVDVTINVTPNNDTSTVAPLVQSMSENSTLTLTSSMFNLMDEETSSGAVYTLTVESFVGGSEFFVNGVSSGIGEGVTFTQEELDNGDVVYSTENADFPNGADALVLYGLEVTLIDGTSTIHTVFEINVTPVNEVPVLNINPNVIEVDEDNVVALPSTALVTTDEENETPVAFYIDNISNNSPFTIEVLGNPTPLQQGDQFTYADYIAGNVLIIGNDSIASTHEEGVVMLTAIMPTAPHSQPAELNITVNAIDDQPTVTLASQEIDEGDQLLLTPAMFQYIDEESPQTAVYTLTSSQDIGGAEWFVNNVSQGTSATFTHQQLVNGQILLNTANANYIDGQQAALNFLLSVETPTGQTTTDNFIITINPVNEPATLTIINTNLMVNENETTILSFGDFSLTDEEGDNAVEYVIGSDISASPYDVLINGNSVPLKIGDSFTHENLVNGDVMVVATTDNLTEIFNQSLFLHAVMDNGPSSNIATLNISIIPVNDTPTLAPSVVSINEGELVTLNATTFNFQDEETPNNATYTLATDDDLHGAFLIIDGVESTSNASFTHTQLINGQVAINTQEATIPEGQPLQIVFTTQVQPISGPASLEEPFVVEITPINEAASLNINSDAYSFNENSQIVLSENDLVVVDEEGDLPVEYIVGTDLSNSAFTLITQGNAVVLSNGDTFSHQDLAAGNVILDATHADITDLYSQNIILTAVMDSGPNSAVSVLSVTINPVDDTPTIAPVDVLLDEGDTVIFDASTFNYQDEETPNNATYTVFSTDNLHNASLVVDGVNVGSNALFTHAQLMAGLVGFDTQLAVIPEGQPTTIAFTVSVQPATGQATTAELWNVVVNPVNELPELIISNDNFTVSENSLTALPQSAFILQDEENDLAAEYLINSDISDNPFSIIIAGSNTPLAQGDSFTHTDLINGNVLLDTTETDLLAPVIQNINITAITENGQNTTPQSFVFTILPENDAPALNPQNIVINEGDLVVLNASTFNYTDEESPDSTVYHLVTNDNLLGTELLIDGVSAGQNTRFTHSQLLGGLVSFTSVNANVPNNQSTDIIFTVIAQPSTGPASEAHAFTITVNPTDDSPTVNPISQQLVENSSLLLNASMLGYSDEENDLLDYIVVESVDNNLGVILTLNGNPVTEGGIITAAQLNQGLVRLDASDANVELGDAINLVFHAVDENSNRTENSILITTVLPDNDAAILMAQTDAITINEGESVALSSASFTLSDEENASVSAYIVQSLPTEPGLTIDKNGVALELNDSFTQQELDAGLITVNATNAPALQNAIDALKVYAVVDDGTRTNATDLQLSIQSVEDIPQLTIANVGSISESGILTLQSEHFSFEDADGDTLVEYQLISSLNTDGFSIQIDGDDLLPEDTFTQADLTAELVTVFSDGTELSSPAMDQFTVVAVSSNGIKSNHATATVMLQPSDDAPTLSAGQPITANENELTTLRPIHFDVTDAENDLPTAYTLTTPIAEDIGVMVVNGEPLNANQSFTHEALVAGDVQIDLQALDITEDTTANFELAVTAGAQTSAPQNLLVAISENNDAPLYTLDAPLSFPPLNEGEVITIPDNLFTDSDNDEMIFTAVVAPDDDGNTSTLPDWLLFNPETMELQVAGTPDVTEMTVLLVADDQNNGQASAPIQLTFNAPPEVLPEPEVAPLSPEPEIAAALPEPVALEAIEIPTIEPETLEPVIEVSDAAAAPQENEITGEPAEDENTEEITESSANFDDSQTITSDIQSARIDLASLLPSLNAFAENNDDLSAGNQTTDSILTEIIGFTNNLDDSDPFNLSDFESQTYRQGLDNLADRWDDDEELTDAALININTTVGSSVGLSSGFTVGYMIWLLRGGTLMGSVLSSLPAWRLVDPLPVLAELDSDLDEDNETLESMVSKTNDAAAPTESTEPTESTHTP